MTSLLNMLPMVFFHHSLIRVTWKNRVTTVVSTPVPSKSTRPSVVQMKVLTTSLYAARLERNCAMMSVPLL